MSPVGASMKRARRDHCVKVCRAVLTHLREAWPRCTGSEDMAFITDVFCDGPDTNCPLGLWANLDPIECAETQEAARVNWRTHMRSWSMRATRRLVRGLIVEAGQPIARPYLVRAVCETGAGFGLWHLIAIITRLISDGQCGVGYRMIMVRACAEAILADMGNDVAFYHIRCCVEDGLVSVQEADTVAGEFGITTPVGG